MSEQWWENAPESDNRFNPTHPDYIPPLYINTDWDGSSNQIGSVHQRQQKFFQKYGMEYLKSPHQHISEELQGHKSTGL